MCFRREGHKVLATEASPTCGPGLFGVRFGTQAYKRMNAAKMCRMTHKENV